jgi:aflatoxin B1 aldehyde reductase
MRVPFEETLSGIDALYREGRFKHFGIANHTAEQVEEVVNICKEKNFVLPTFFQGSYNPIARLPEDELLPVLRKHNISFVAYSPMAGGFLAKTSQQFRDQPDSLQGRWNKAGFLGKVYQFLYNKPRALDALDKWHEIAAAEGISGAEMAYRWVAHNSALTKDDGMVIGATTIEQWKSNLKAVQKGPLSPETAAKIDALWTPELKMETVSDNWEAVKAVMVSPM